MKLANGLEIYADRIISDATIWNLYGKLIKPEHLSKDKIDWANKFEPSAAAAIAYITVKKEAIPGGTTSIEAFIDDLTVVEKNNYFVYIPSIDDPSICPEDMHSVSILCSPGDYDWPRPWDPRYKSQEYENEKQKLLEDALNVVGKRFPHFRENIVTVDVASPSTTERFTLRNYGIVGGPKQTLGQHLLNRLKSRTDIEGLYAVGDSTVLGEGVTSVTSSALGAANSVLKDLEMPLYLIKKPKRSYVHYVEGKTRLPLPDQDEALNSVNSVRLANECQWCEDTKCMKKCPAGIDIPNFVRRIEAGNIIGAARAIREKIHWVRSVEFCVLLKNYAKKFVIGLIFLIIVFGSRIYNFMLVKKQEKKDGLHFQVQTLIEKLQLLEQDLLDSPVRIIFRAWDSLWIYMKNMIKWVD